MTIWRLRKKNGHRRKWEETYLRRGAHGRCDMLWLAASDAASRCGLSCLFCVKHSAPPQRRSINNERTRHGGALAAVDIACLRGLLGARGKSIGDVCCGDCGVHASGACRGSSRIEYHRLGIGRKAAWRTAASGAVAVAARDRWKGVDVE